MTTPLWCLLGFAAWTLLIVVLAVAPFRVGSVLAGKASPKSFPAEIPHGPDWYRRVLRAHANCVENLPVFAVVVIVGHLAGVRDTTFDLLSQVYLGARICQTVTHIASGRGLIINVRFTFFVVQLVCIAAMMFRIATAA